MKQLAITFAFIFWFCFCVSLGMAVELGGLHWMNAGVLLLFTILSGITVKSISMMEQHRENMNMLLDKMQTHKN